MPIWRTNGIYQKMHNQARCKIQSAVRYSLSQRTNTIQSAWKDNIYLKKTMYYSSMTFLANGEAFKAAENLIKECGANISGVGIVIEKAFQKGHKYIVDAGYDFCALASIASIKDKKITWAE